jgi:hypothetical protein
MGVMGSVIASSTRSAVWLEMKTADDPNNRQMLLFVGLEFFGCDERIWSHHPWKGVKYLDLQGSSFDTTGERRHIGRAKIQIPAASMEAPWWHVKPAPESFSKPRDANRADRFS